MVPTTMNIRIFLTLMMVLVLTGCGNAAGSKWGKAQDLKKGVRTGMKTYHMGRFAIDVPAEFKLEVQQQKIRYAEVSDFLWKNNDPREKEREILWREKVTSINNKQKPVNNEKTIIEEKTLQGLGKWSKAVVYRGNYLVPELICWTLLVDYGDVGVWLTLDGTSNEMTVNNFTNILSSYHYGSNQNHKANFSLKYGVISLPYLEQESTYARFEGPMGMYLKLDMREIHQKPKEEGIISRTFAAMLTGFASGIDIKKIRSRKRTAAGLPGEEEILQGEEGGKKNVSFDWEYLGKVDSGEAPMIQISIDTKADNLDEKIKIWDKVIDSFRPVK